MTINRPFIPIIKKELKKERNEFIHYNIYEQSKIPQVASFLYLHLARVKSISLTVINPYMFQRPMLPITKNNNGTIYSMKDEELTHC